MTAHRVARLPKDIFNDDMVFIRAVRKGISGQVVRETVELLGGHQQLVAELAGTTPGNLHRIYKKHALGKTESEGILDLLRLFAYAATTFDSDDIVREWFGSEIPALSGTRPIDLMDTFQGRAVVRDVLSRIEHGEFS
ncbi:antitoxin Xre/MbcA/ParS toxin-binding domain-containing protein [Halomonas sp.]|uniref:antitoxin Xre/MbcA/ParS toxin-binding domain-containing protein n=1 Tax=Halomonas sp. TaxID=1486246 RepID=UPI00298E534B|nr:antitoxin Xre/MbcA/ParS toxin-binding domain-containing protein [Halomonas sp.]MDW7748207.1 antitoxin Xre/MbcA/ParS toxin-binding domain-containing protein [Halomonas sp.]